MPPSGFNKSSWPAEGPHRELLDCLDAVHRHHGCRSLREIGKAMHLSYSRVHDIVRGTSLPVDETQTRALVDALSGGADPDAAAAADRAAELFVAARRVRDRAEPLAIVRSGPAPRPPADAPPDPSPTPVLRIAVAAVVMVLMVAVGWWSGRSSALDDPATPSVVLEDSFDADELDPATWAAPSRPDLIRTQGGALTMRVGPADTASGVEARLTPRELDGFRQISYVVSVPEYAAAGPGGATMTLAETDGRTHQVFFGPSTGGPEVAVLVCSKRACSDYDDYDPPERYERFAVGETVPIRVVQSDGRLRFYVRDRLVAQGPPDDAPLDTFWIDLYGAEREDWRITVDSLLVTR